MFKYDAPLELPRKLGKHAFIVLWILHSAAMMKTGPVTAKWIQGYCPEFGINTITAALQKLCNPEIQMAVRQTGGWAINKDDAFQLPLGYSLPDLPDENPSGRDSHVLDAQLGNDASESGDARIPLGGIIAGDNLTKTAAPGSETDENPSGRDSYVLDVQLGNGVGESGDARIPLGGILAGDNLTKTAAPGSEADENPSGRDSCVLDAQLGNGAGESGDAKIPLGGIFADDKTMETPKTAVKSSENPSGRDFHPNSDSRLESLNLESLNLDLKTLVCKTNAEKLCKQSSLLFGKAVKFEDLFKQRDILEILGWMAQAYVNKSQKIKTPWGFVYRGLRRELIIHGKPAPEIRPDSEFLADPFAFLPSNYLEAVGLTEYYAPHCKICKERDGKHLASCSLNKNANPISLPKAWESQYDV